MAATTARSRSKPSRSGTRAKPTAPVQFRGGLEESGKNAGTISDDGGTVRSAVVDDSSSHRSGTNTLGEKYDNRLMLPTQPFATRRTSGSELDSIRRAEFGPVRDSIDRAVAFAAAPA